MAKKIFVTKYALSKGIQEFTVVRDADPNDHYQFIHVKHQQGLNGEATFHRGEWHYTKEEASTAAEVMRVKRILSLKKQIKELETFKF